uniref:Cytoplasmic dynein 2 heavy chain 1 n=1 Tax=Ciona savignyi TaxID=51511 RepID=H2ZF03_CIOSA
NLERAESRVLKLGKALDEVDARVLELRNKFEKRTTEAAQLRLEVEKANETIASAETLVGKLGSEHQRWNDQVKSLTSELTSLPACAQLASAFITYLPSAPEDVRREMVQSWMELIKLPSKMMHKSNNQRGANLCKDITIYTTFKEILLFDSSLFNFGADSFFDIMFPYLLLLIVGPRYVVQLGEKTVDYNEEFRLFMTTRNPHPDIPPDAASIISEVDFTTTRAGLKGQLLAITIQHEKPELEERKTGLLQKEESLKIELAKLEDSLLQQLAKAEGNILENKELLQSLNQTKASSLDITQSLSESQQMEASLDQERNAYLPLAECGSTLYFVISDLSKINNMKRENICVDKEGRKRENIPVWIETERHRAVSMLRSSFPTLYSSLKLDDSGAWMTFARSSQCEHDIPQAVAAKLSHFQQILVVQTLRPDRLQSAMSLLASRMLGIREISPPATSLRRLHESGTTHAAEPVLIVLSPGADPSEELQELASSVVGEENYFQVAMGQGQSDVAMQLVRECARNGQWLFLKNLHLVTSWLPILEKELNGLVPDSNFRLWLTSEVHPKFPPVLLQSSLKITYEAPPGIKKNLFRTYDNWSPEFVASGTKHSKPSALFALAWFHAVTQERRNFIPQGWTKFYEFSLGDLRAAATIIDHLFAGSSEVQWQPMHGLMENAIYGGRVDNIFDMRVLTSYLTQYFDSDLLSASSRSRGKRLVANVTLPQSTNIKDYIDVIEKLPEDDLPSYFGLPANIERSAQRVNSQRVISQLKTLMRSVEAGAKFDREAWQSELGPILQLWKKLNQGSTSVIHAKVEVPAVSDASPVLQFVMLERYNAIKVVQKVHQTLSSLSKVMRGSQLLTTDVHKLANSILQQETPVQWHSMWEGPEDPMNYLHSLVAKTMALQGWAEKAEKGSLLGSNELNLADLFHPNTFLNAVRQQTARETRVSMDELKFACSWKGTISGAKTNVKIGGLQLEGCSFDGLRLSENQRDSPTVSAVPTLHAAWVPKDTPGPYSSNETISLPIYTSPNRESIVTCLDVPCGGQAKTWIQSGAALLLQ